MLSPIKLKIPNNINTYKNCLSNSPKSQDSNYSSYIKDKSLTNYLKGKKNNFDKIIKNKYICDSNTSKICGTFSNKIKFNKIENNNNRNRNRTLLLTSLFYLPRMNSKDCNSTIKNKSKFKSLFNYYNSNHNSFYKNNKYTNKKEENAGIKIENYMKDKFYEDIDKKMNIKLKSKKFLHDSSIKERIIKMNKIGSFWGGIFEYCNPLLSVKKLRYEKNIYHKNKIKDEDKYIEEYNSKINKVSKPILYTNELFCKLMRKEKIKNEIKFKKLNIKYDNILLNK